MSDDLTQKLPGDKEPTTPQGDDQMSVLIGLIQSLSTNFQSLSAAFQGLEVRVEAIEKTVTQRSLETKPIWERALAEIAETRAELAETRAEMKDGFRKLSIKFEVLSEDSMTLRGDQRLLERRVDALESKNP